MLLWFATACETADPTPDGGRRDDATRDDGGPHDAAVGGDGGPRDAAAPSDGDGAVADAGPRLVLRAVAPRVIDPLGGSHVVVAGEGFGAGIDAVRIGGRLAELRVRSDRELEVVTASVAPGEHAVEVWRGAERVTLPAAVLAWSPAEITGAHLFDAAHGVELAAAQTNYEWQRTTASIGDAWRARDGNTLTWLPSTRRFYMVGGWNGLLEPEGFSHVPPELGIYPLQNTTDEVWSSPDGVTWTLELPHEHGQFERRHVHNTIAWRDRLWVIGGDAHQGFHNHDVLSSADGRTWTVHLGPGRTPPPWEPRGMQISGVYAGKLWTMGGQTMLGESHFFNDVWNTDDGVTWTQVAADGPAGPTRFGHCSGVGRVAEFAGRMWIVGCGCDTSGADCTEADLRAEVWSTTDGQQWRRHARPPWTGKTWHDVLVFDDKLWILFGFGFGDPSRGIPTGNAAEFWWTTDGESWTPLPADVPVPGSHAQGVAATDEFVLFAGGNHSFGDLVSFDRSAWRMVPFRGESVESWRARGEPGRVVRAPRDSARPVRIEGAFATGAAGLHFDGSIQTLDLVGEAETHPAGWSVFWVGRAPHLPGPYGWVEVGAPVSTVVGGPGRADGLPVRAVGLSDGRLVVHAMEVDLGPIGESVWARVAAGQDLQAGPGEVRLVGVTETATGALDLWVDGARVGRAGPTRAWTPPTWSQLGGGMTDDYYGPNTRFGGTLGAVVIAPGPLDASTVARLQAWAVGRFGVR